MAIKGFYSFLDFDVPTPLNEEEEAYMVAKIQHYSCWIADHRHILQQDIQRAAEAPAERQDIMNEIVDMGKRLLNRMLRTRHLYACELNIGEHFPAVLH